MDALDEALARLLRDGAWTESLASEPQLLERVEAHGLAPLLQARLEHADLPAALRGALREAARRAAGVELARRAELIRVLALLHARGIAPVLLKGAALAHVLYAQPHLRPSMDADLMVGPQQRRAVADTLRAEGYASTAFQGGTLVNAQASYWRELTAGTHMTFDVHWRIATTPLFSRVLTYDELRARARPLPALGPHALAPAPVDALLHACVHRAGVVARHPGQERLIWLHDIHLLAGAFDARAWSEFVERAAHHRVRGICRAALEAAGRLLGTQVPPEVESALSAEGHEPSAALFGGDVLRLKLAELASLPSAGERLTYLRETALPAPAYMYERYGTHRRWLLPALYVRRAFGWLAR